MRYFKQLIVFFILLIFACQSILTSAHSGRTDSGGGHHDYNNASDLGGYHYHHGMGPHLHSNGICPYSISSSSSSSSTKKSKQKNIVKKAQKKLNKLGYKCGTPDGILGSKTKKCIKKFQKKNGLKVTGTLNKKTKKKLKIS